MRRSMRSASLHDRDRRDQTSVTGSRDRVYREARASYHPITQRDLDKLNLAKSTGS